MRLKFDFWKFFSVQTFLILGYLIIESRQFQCPDKFGHYPDSGDCSKYYICDHGRVLEAKCDSGLHYNTQLKTCDWPRNVQCISGGDRVNSIPNRDIRKKSYYNEREKSHPISSAEQPNQLHPQNDEQWNSEPITDKVFDETPVIEPDFVPNDKPEPPLPPPRQINRGPPAVKRNFKDQEPKFSFPPTRTPITRPTSVPAREEARPLRKPDYNPEHNPDYDYDPESDDYDYKQPSHDSQKAPKEETRPQNRIDTTTKAPPVKRMGWLPHDRDSIDMDQYHWSADDAVDFSQDKPRIPNEAYVRMQDFVNVEKQLEEDESPNNGEPPEDDYYDDNYEEENTPPPPPPPKGNGYVKFSYANDRAPKVVRYDDEDEGPPLPHSPNPGRPPVPARKPPQGRAAIPLPPHHSNDEEDDEPEDTGPPPPTPRYYRYDSRENGPKRPPVESSNPTTGSRNTNKYIKSVPNSSAPKPNAIVNKKPNNSQNWKPIEKNINNKHNENISKPNGKLINSMPRTKKPNVSTRQTGNKHKVVNAMQSVTPSVYKVLKSYQKKIPDIRLQQKNFAEDLRDSIIDNYMNNNKPNYILNDKDFNDQKSHKPPVVSGEEDNVRDFDTDFEPINVSNGKNERHIKPNYNIKWNKGNTSVDQTDLRDKAIHRYMNTDAIVKQQKAQDSVSSLSTVLPPVREKTPKTPTITLIINHEKIKSDYKPAIIKPPQIAYDAEPFETTTTPPKQSTPRTRIRINAPQSLPKPQPKEVVEDEREVYERPTPNPTQNLNSQQSYVKASKCHQDFCTRDCRCGGTDIPGGFQAKQIPQIVLLTFDDSVNDLNHEIYEDLFNSGRNNPNGCPISGTFYVSHEWTDYAQVQSLYARGHELASHSITHSFGEKFSKDLWYKEIAGQRELLHLYGGVKAEDVRGMRAPFLQTGGNTMFEMLYEANFTYDSSLPVYDINPPYYPYTLDYAINHECMITPCPTKSFPGVWEVGMVMWEDLRDGRCSMADACFNPTDEQGVYQMVKNNFDRHYKTNRSPFGIYFHSRWFLTDHNKKGFIKFLDEVTGMKDVYFVTNWQMIQWMRDPTPLSKIKDFKPFKCDFSDRPQECLRPYNCKVKLKSEVRVLKTCQSCPKVYPWRANNGLKSNV